MNTMKPSMYMGRHSPSFRDPGNLTSNHFGDATALYRSAKVREVGGWFGDEREPWEDWQLFLRLSLRGYRVVHIPLPLVAYRVRSDSMLRTYSQFGGYRRLADALADGLGPYAWSFVRRALMAPNREQFEQGISESAQVNKKHLELAEWRYMRLRERRSVRAALVLAQLARPIFLVWRSLLRALR